MTKNQIHLSEEQLKNIIAENVRKTLSEDFGAGMRAVGSRLKNDVGGIFGKPSFGREYYGGSYKNTFKDASMESDYWKLGKELESGVVKDNPIVILDKVKKFGEYGVISQESCKKVLGLIKRGNYQEAGHELCYGTMSFGAGEDEIGPTDYEKRHGIRQLEESRIKEIVAESVKKVLKEGYNQQIVDDAIQAILSIRKKVSDAATQVVFNPGQGNDEVSKLIKQISTLMYRLDRTVNVDYYDSFYSGQD